MTGAAPAYPLRAALAGVLLFAIGLALAGGIYRAYRQDLDRLSGWRRADGIVVELLKRRTPEGDVVAPVVRFTTTAGDRVSVTLDPRGSKSPLYVDAPVAVLYHPDRPQEARIDTRGRRWTGHAVAGGAALLLMALGGYVAWYASRWDRMQPPEHGH